MKIDKDMKETADVLTGRFADTARISYVAQGVAAMFLYHDCVVTKAGGKYIVTAICWLDDSRETTIHCTITQAVEFVFRTTDMTRHFSVR